MTKIGKYKFEHPIIQGGMGIGISWNRLAGAVSKEGGLGVISSVGTSYYQYPKYAGELVDGKPKAANFCSPEALKEIFKRARKICGNTPLGANVMVALSEYKANVIAACEAGANIIISGAGLPIALPDIVIQKDYDLQNLPEDLAEHAKSYPDVALVPIISSGRALKLICMKWKKYGRIPDAIIVEGPKSGGHQGFSLEQCSMEEYQLENIIPEVLKEAAEWGDIPVFAAGGIWDKDDIDWFIGIGCAGVQMGTRFIATHECDAPDYYKQLLINTNAEDIKLGGSPVGLPSRRIITNLHELIANGEAPKIKCISNCVKDCHNGIGAKREGYCIADRLADAILDRPETGLYFSGANGFRVNEIISVHELMKKLTEGE
jgi:nitronate monooxygenase